MRKREREKEREIGIKRSKDRKMHRKVKNEWKT